MDTPLRTLIVDDEELARRRLARVLTREPNIEIIGEAADGAQALELIRELRPELVFLDVQMPKIDGLTVIRSFDSELSPHVIFVTAYNEYLEAAFRAHALDYVQKPYTDAQIHSAVAYARIRVAERRAFSNRADERIAALLHDLGTAASAPDKVVTLDAGRGEFRRVPIHEIEYIEASNNLLTVHLATRPCAWRTTLAEAERRLAADGFVRVARSILVNKAHVVGVSKIYRREYSLHLRTGRRVSTGRSYADPVEAAFQLDSDRQEH